ncbi:MAG: NAD(P)-dependent oxidoreductase [Sedimenticola sp.]
MKKVLILGHTGKMGLALCDAFADDYEVVGLNSSDFNAINANSLLTHIKAHSPDIVINTAAALGIDVCEQNPLSAFQVNTAFPRFLAEISNQHNFQLIHFSTDAVFSDAEGGYYSEEDRPSPLNVYGATKLAGDWSVADVADNYLIARISVLFGLALKPNQFVEKMLLRIRSGEKELKVADDIIASPSYSRDIAGQILNLADAGTHSGLYHVVNSGHASLYDLIQAIIEEKRIPVKIGRVSCKVFPSTAVKNTYTPLTTSRIEPLRDWRDAVKDYCTELDI